MKTTMDIRRIIINEILDATALNGSKKEVRDNEMADLMNLPLAALELILDGAKKYIYDRKQA